MLTPQPDPEPRPERRIAARVAVERAVTVLTEAGACPARTVNVSTSGLLVALERALTIWAEVAVVLPGVGTRPARVARHDGDHYGLVLREPLSADEFQGLTGVAIPEAPVEPFVAPRPAGRTAPWAFGRDRFKTLKREAAARAEAVRR